jgi:hypothetical protein
LNKRHKPFDFDKEISKHMGRERKVDSKQEAVLNRMLKEPDQWASIDPRLGIYYLLKRVINHRRLCRRYLRSCYGYEVPVLRNNNITAGRFLRPERLPRNEKEATWLVIWWSEWAAREVAFHGMCTILLEDERRDKDTYRAVREACKQAMGTLNDFKTSLLLDGSYADGRLEDWLVDPEVIAWFSARVAMKTSLQANLRLKHSLEEESKSPFSKLLEELPGTVPIELDNLVREGKPPSALARRVAKHLEELGGQSAKLQRKERLAEGEVSDLPTNEPMLEEFLLKEELEELRISSGLSEREYQVLELMLEQYTEEEIAEKLEISKGSVKTYKLRLREKLKQAAGL